MGPSKRKKILVGMVRVSKWGWSMPMGPLKRKREDSDWAGQGVYVGMVEGHGAVIHEEDCGWEGQGV